MGLEEFTEPTKIFLTRVLNDGEGFRFSEVCFGVTAKGVFRRTENGDRTC